MATIRIIVRCDYCGTEQEFDSEEDFFDSEWWQVQQREMELFYCERECLISDLSLTLPKDD